jgi:glycosyltransferase involved in cell wall biosynthesis
VFFPRDDRRPCWRPGLDERAARKYLAYSLSPQTRPAQNYLAFLGRIARPDAAIRIARTVGLPLRIAAKIPRSESRYFKEHIRPFVDGSRVEFVGEVDDAAKAGFLGNAAALLFPIDWPEPFGLVVIEAMACGTR